MKKFKFYINNNPYEVNVKGIEKNILKVDVNGQQFNVEVEKQPEAMKTPTIVRQTAAPSTETHKATALTSAPSGKKGAGSIKAPLPGTIVNIFIKPGDDVKIGQKLLTYEAMKMENNLSSDREGKVKDIKVKSGDTVLEGDTLIEIE